jgi:hypothetical protein
VGARFFAHAQTGPVTHPAFYTMSAGSFPGLKSQGRGADHPPVLVPGSRKSRAIPIPPVPSGLLQGTFTYKTLTRGLHMLRQKIPRQTLGTNGKKEYKILKFSAYYETLKFIWDQSDYLGTLV